MSKRKFEIKSVALAQFIEMSEQDQLHIVQSGRLVPDTVHDTRSMYRFVPDKISLRAFHEFAGSSTYQLRKLFGDETLCDHTHLKAYSPCSADFPDVIAFTKFLIDHDLDLGEKAPGYGDTPLHDLASASPRNNVDCSFLRSVLETLFQHADFHCAMLVESLSGDTPLGRFVKFHGSNGEQRMCSILRTMTRSTLVCVSRILPLIPDLNALVMGYLSSESVPAFRTNFAGE